MSKLFIALIFLFSFCSIVHAKEYIDTYHVDITILDNGNISVTENIKVWAEGKDIKRGIYRWFPLKNVEKYQRSVPYMNLRVTRNGQPEKIGKTERKSDSIAYYFGDKDVFIETNTFHNYAISYEVDKAILQFDESDQLYWNIIPFFWEFPISNISAKVKFPETANYLGVELFSGSFGSKTNGLNVSYLETNDGISFQGTEFEREQGLTARIKFEPSLVPASEQYPVINDAYRKAEKDAQEKNEKQYTKNVAIFASLSSLLLCVTVNLWFLIGREENVIPTVIPQFYPPKDISPLAARYTLRQGNVDGIRMITIALVSMATKGIIKLSQNEVELRDPKSPWMSLRNRNLSKGEALLLKELSLLSTGDKLSISYKNEEFANRLNKIAKKVVAFSKQEFFENVVKNIPARLILLSLLFGVILFGTINISEIMFLFTLPIALFLSKKPLLFGGKIYVFCFLGFPGMTGIWLSLSNKQVPEMLDFVLFCGGIFLIINFYIIYYSLKNYSKSGGSIIGQLEGLKMYIKAAEHYSLEDEPRPTEEQFTAIYPYAFAMGLETVWANKFKRELKAADSSDSLGLYWYGGSYRRFENSFSEAANYSPPSSDGSSGGGGGGGGGGW